MPKVLLQNIFLSKTAKLIPTLIAIMVQLLWNKAPFCYKVKHWKWVKEKMLWELDLQTWVMVMRTSFFLFIWQAHNRYNESWHFFFFFCFDFLFYSLLIFTFSISEIFFVAFVLWIIFFLWYFLLSLEILVIFLF